ncbi:uncharacterized protein LOC124669568 isoform X1 [Lolium rigidum]|uniref:uncharacterized protein LOC124669568 isoform X1 n=1 Tax=Lolium rigidum TaxID=89674 RepID=UPI001F5E04FC|nr:uncharacterized protein LOC124669568 isoform X1 [Lolium rigidum]
MVGVIARLADLNPLNRVPSIRAHLEAEVMINLGVAEIPECHIMRRWTRDAYRDMPEHLMLYQKDSATTKSTSFRHSALYRTAIEIVQMADSNPESCEVAMSHFLDAIPILSETNKIKDGLGLEERVQAAGRANPSVIFESGSLRPDIVAPSKSLVDQLLQETSPATRRSVCQEQNSAPYAVAGFIGRIAALPTRTRSHVERPIARIAVWLGTRRTIA